MPVSCEVCHEIVSKYKCPQCLLKYCSLPCYRQHKGACITLDDGLTSRNISQNTELEKASAECAVDSEDFVNEEQLKKLESDSHLHHMLQNPHLQQLLRDVNSASDTKLCLDKAMKEPLFIEFAEQCLNVVDNHENTQPDLIDIS